MSFFLPKGKRKVRSGFCSGTARTLVRSGTARTKIIISLTVKFCKRHCSLARKNLAEESARNHHWPRLCHDRAVPETQEQICALPSLSLRRGMECYVKHNKFF